MNSNSDMIQPESRLQQSLYKLNSIILKSQAVLISLENEYIQLGGIKSDLEDETMVKELEFEIGGLEAFGRRLIGRFTPEQRKQQILNNYSELSHVMAQANQFNNALDDVSVSNNTKVENKLVSQSQELEDSLLLLIKQSRSKSDKANEVVNLSPSIPSTLDVINNVSYEPEVTVEEQYQDDLLELEESDIDAITRLNNQIKEAELKMIESSIDQELSTTEELITYARPGVGNLFPQLKEVIYVGLMNRFQIGLDFHDNLVAIEKSDFQDSPSLLTIELKNGHLNLYSKAGKTYKVLHLRTKIQNQINEERSPRLTTQSKLTLPAKQVKPVVEAAVQTVEESVKEEILPIPPIKTQADPVIKTPKKRPDIIRISSTITQKPTLKKSIDDYVTTINLCLEQGLSPTFVDNQFIELRDNNGILIQKMEVNDPTKQAYFLEHKEELDDLQIHREMIVNALSIQLNEYKEANPEVNFQVVVAPEGDKKINLGFFPIEPNGNRGKFQIVRIGSKAITKSGVLINKFSNFSSLILNDPRIVVLLK
jgi:hypothetical protein